MKTVGFTALIPVLLYIVSAYLFVSSGHEHAYPPFFVTQALFLFALILVSQLGVFFLYGSAYALLPIGIQMGASVLIGYPLTAEILTETVLYSAVLLNVGLALPHLLATLIAVPYILLFLSVQTRVVVWWESVSGPGLPAVVFLLTFNTLFFVLGLTISWYRRQRTIVIRQLEQLNSTVDELASANLGFQNYADTIVERSLDDERKRISRDLHDTVGYALTNIRMLMEEALGSYDGNSQEVEQLLEQTRNQARDTLEETRSTLGKLRKITDITEPSDLRAVNRITEAFRRATNVNITLEHTNTALSYGPDIDRCLYRFFQEAMTNAFRHGRATHLQVHMFEHDNELKAYVLDNGRGCPDIEDGLGLSGMRERLNEVNGTLSTINMPNGFQVMARIPIRQKVWKA